MAAPILVSDLIDQVRAQVDEANHEVLTDFDILQAINRGQDYAIDILARYYPEPLLKSFQYQLVSGQTDYDLPEDMFEDRLMQVNIRKIGTQRIWPTERISFTRLADVQSTTVTDVPWYHAIIGRHFRLSPPPNGVNQVEGWYVREIESLELPQGRIDSISIANRQLTLSNMDTALVSYGDAAFVNIVDGTTGEVKATMQIQSVTLSPYYRVVFRATPTSATWLGKTVVGEIPSTVEAGDYICYAAGTCVPYFKKPITNFLVQYAIAEVRRRLGEEAALEEQVLKRFEEQVVRTWANRSSSNAIKNRATAWRGFNFRKWWRY